MPYWHPWKLFFYLNKNDILNYFNVQKFDQTYLHVGLTILGSFTATIRDGIAGLMERSIETGFSMDSEFILEGG